MLPNSVCYALRCWTSAQDAYTGKIRISLQKQNKTIFAGVENYGILKKSVLHHIKSENGDSGPKLIQVGRPAGIAQCAMRTYRF